MFDAKLLADILTAARLLLAAAIVTLGFTGSAQALPVVVWLTIAAWTSDVLDGVFARYNRMPRRTWIGDHDLLFDMSIAAALIIYMAITGHLNLWVAAVYLLTALLVFWRLGLSAALGKLFQAPAYLWFIIIALRETPLSGIWLLVWILLAIILTWPRFPRQTIPDFLSAASESRPHPAEGGDESQVSPPLN
jgi:cardiolipin synthase